MPNQNYADMVRRARDEMPRRLGYDETWTQSDMAIIVGCTANHWAMIERSETDAGTTFQRCLDYAMQMAAHNLDPRAPSMW